MRLKTAMNYFVFVGVCCIGATASAGRYVITYSHPGCKVEMRGPLGIYWTLPYGTDYGACQGSGTGVDPLSGSSSLGGPGWVKCSGKITAFVAWDNEGDPTSKPPECVVIRQTSIASWAGNSGSCDNGLGHPDVGGTSQGTKYQVKNNPGSSFKLECSPSAEANRGSSAPTASVSYHVAVIPLRIVLDGTIEDSEGANALVGSVVNGSVVAETFQTELSFRSHLWSVGGDIFKQFVVTQDQEMGYVVDFGFNDTFLSSPSWAWKDKAEEVHISCNFSVYVGGVNIGTGNLATGARVLRPDYTFYGDTDGEVSYTGGPFNTVKAGGSHDDDHGIDFIANIKTPEPFKSSWGDGQGMFCQFCTLNRYTLCMSGTTTFHYKVFTAGWELDNSWPYVPPFPADGFAHQDADSPSWTLTSLAVNYRVNDAYLMYLMFIPPGYGGKYPVPLGVVPWSWTAQGGRSSLFDAWPHPINGKVERGERVDTTTHPEWNERFVNAWAPPVPGP